MAADPPPVPHEFVNPALSYEQSPNKQNYLRILTFFKKKPGITFEYFLNHWHHVHTDLVINMKSFKENNIFNYTQFYQTRENREQGRSLGYTDMEWDACSEFWVHKIEDYHAFIQSQEYKDSLCKAFGLQCLSQKANRHVDDVEHFIDLNGGMRVMVGPVVLILGHAIPGYGKDGVLPSSTGAD